MTGVELIRDPYRLQSFCAALDSAHPVGLVPTMGALHAGHMELVQASRRLDEWSVVSIFVNPTQFSPGEDYARYPRRLEQDCALLEMAGVHAVFAPSPEAMYGAGETTRVEVGGLSERLCGASRPGHFVGVATIVLKLFQLAAPTRAYFGQKDAAQVAVIRRLIVDLFLPVEMIVCPIVREPDGLAMSSRNAYLSPEDRLAAGALSRSLRQMGECYHAGERANESLLQTGRRVLAAEPRLRLDYLSAVDGDTLLPCEQATPGTLFAVAAFAGATRLIDNARVDAAGAWML